MNSKYKVYKKIFNFGEMRTGTSSLHQYLKRVGFKAIHHFEKEAGTVDKDMNIVENRQKVVTYIKNTNFVLYSDYPIRHTYIEIMECFPDALYIMTVRKNKDEWVNSVINYFNIQKDSALEMWENSKSRDNDIMSFSRKKNIEIIKLEIDGDLQDGLDQINCELHLGGKLIFPHINRWKDKID